jgi:CMP-N,N'-diacetyllegionaminic acid synthase
MNILGIVPARAGSKRLKGKNLLPLAGKPLVEHVILAALGARHLSAVIVTSDDPGVLEIAKRFPAVTAVRRPEAISGDAALAHEFVSHAIEVYVHLGHARPDAFAIIQPTSPLTLPEDIDGTIEVFLRTGADSAVSVMPLDFAVHPSKLKVMEGSRLKGYWMEELGKTANHQLPQLYARNGAVYVSKIKVLADNRVISDDCVGHVMPRHRSIDINDQADYDYARFLVETKAGL